MSKIVLPPHSAPLGVLTNGALAFSRDQLRARDLEVARVVLEAAAKKAEKWPDGVPRIAREIRALKVSHE